MLVCRVKQKDWSVRKRFIFFGVRANGVAPKKTTTRRSGEGVDALDLHAAARRN
jgi:hypothetical protein